jgi:NADH-quinone oxidoreductase subunit N
VIAALAASGLAADFTAPKVSYSGISPMLAVFGAATVGVLVEAFAPRRLRAPAQLVVAMLGLIGGLVAVGLLASRREITAVGAIAIDGPTLFLQGTILALGVGSLLLLAERSLDSAGGGAIVAQAAAVPGSADERALAGTAHMQTEVFPLAMFAIGGMLLFPAANDLLLMFVALEVLSLPLYLMCGLARRRRLLSQEAAVKYFLLGAFSSGFFIYGVALLYGYAGTVSLGGIALATQSTGSNDGLLYLGLGLLAVGLLFKVSAVPFHSWTPDVYQGAPTPVTALMASGTKVAAFGALLRVFYVALGGVRWDWRPMLWTVAILTMIVGAVLAITQRDVKRMLAYSSIAHAGFLLTGVVATSRAGLSGSLFYLLTYGFTTLAAFGVITLVRDADGEATDLSRWAGLGRRSPLIAGIFALLLLALAGIPLTSGFTGKFAVFAAAVDGGAGPLVVVAVISSAIAAFFYVRVIVLMFFNDPAPDGPTVAIPGAFTAVALALGVAVTLVLGIYPSPLLKLADQAALFLR